MCQAFCFLGLFMSSGLIRVPKGIILIQATGSVMHQVLSGGYLPKNGKDYYVFCRTGAFSTKLIHRPTHTHNPMLSYQCPTPLVILGFLWFPRVSWGIILILSSFIYYGLGIHLAGIKTSLIIQRHFVLKILHNIACIFACLAKPMSQVYNVLHFSSTEWNSKLLQQNLNPPNRPEKCVFFKPSVGYRRETSTVTLGKPVQRWFKCHVSFCKGRLTFEWPLMHSDLSVSWLSTVYKWVAVKHLAIFCKCTAAISKAWEFKGFFHTFNTDCD